MKTKISLLFGMIMFLIIGSCSIFKPNTKKTITKTENKIERQPSGTVETSNVITTQIVTERNPKNLPPAIIPQPTVNEPPAPVFTPTTDEVIKGGNKITIKAQTTTDKKPTAYTQDVKSDTWDTTTPGFDCNVQKIVINANSSTFMNADYEAQGQHIYPGAIYYYNDFKSGNYREVNQDRNSIKLLADVPNMTGATWNIVDQPEVAAIRDAIAALYTRFDNKAVGTMNLRYQTFESNTAAEFSLRLSGGASYSGFSLENEYKNTSTSNRHNLTIDAIKPLYTISCKLPYSKNYFKNGTTVDASKNPIVISSVTYGIRVLANFNLETDTKSELNNFKARYSGVGSTAHIDFDYLSKNDKTDQTINCYVVGGPGNSTIAFSKDELEKGLKDLVGGVTYATARPISYELQDLAGNVIETVSATDEITTRKCVPHYDEPVLQAVILQFKTAGGHGDGKDHDSHFAAYLKKGINGDFNGTGNAANCVDRRDVEYKTGSFIQETMTISGAEIKKSDFETNNGGTVYFHFTHDGDDEWKIDNFSISLIFKNEDVKTINLGGFTLSDENEDHVLFFNRNFTQIQ